MAYARVALAIVLGLYGLHRLATWAERQGWVYYRKRRGHSDTMGNAFLAIQAMIEPSKRHVLEERKKDEEEGRESGDPPAGGKR